MTRAQERQEMTPLGSVAIPERAQVAVSVAVEREESAASRVSMGHLDHLVEPKGQSLDVAPVELDWTATSARLARVGPAHRFPAR